MQNLIIPLLYASLAFAASSNTIIPSQNQVKKQIVPSKVKRNILIGGGIGTSVGLGLGLRYAYNYANSPKRLSERIAPNQCRALLYKLVAELDPVAIENSVYVTKERRPAPYFQYSEATQRYTLHMDWYNGMLSREASPENKNHLLNLEPLREMIESGCVSDMHIFIDHNNYNFRMGKSDTTSVNEKPSMGSILDIMQEYSPNEYNNLIDYHLELDYSLSDSAQDKEGWFNQAEFLEQITDKYITLKITPPVSLKGTLAYQSCANIATKLKFRGAEMTCILGESLPGKYQLLNEERARQ